MDLAGLRVLVTGASRGIGKETAKAFAARGAELAVAARSAEALEALTDDIGGKAYPIDRTTPESIDELLALDLATPIKLTSQVVGPILERGRGHIAQVSSIAGITPVPGAATYCATKAGLSQATACIELELRGTDVHLTTGHIGGVDTEMSKRVVNDDMMAKHMKRLAMLGFAKLAAPEAIAQAIVNAVDRDDAVADGIVAVIEQFQESASST